MQESIYARINRTLSWRRVVGFNVVLLLVLIVPISVRLAQEDTENRSSAAVDVPQVEPPVDYPSGDPKIERVNTFFGKVGDTIVIIGANYGAYQWGSQVYVGDTLVDKDNIVRWSNNILEVKIPSSARTGAVWVSINGKTARWDGSLLLFDVARSAQVGLTRVSPTQGAIYSTNASLATAGMIELSYVSEPFEVVASSAITITGQSTQVDSLGKKMKITFVAREPLSSAKTTLAQVNYPGIGNVEIVRAELHDAGGRMISIFVDPLAIKLSPE